MKFEWEKGCNQEVFGEPLYFESFQQSMRFNSLPWATVSFHDMIYFGLATGDRNALHVNESYAKKTPVGGIVVHGELVMNSLFGALHFIGFWEKTLAALRDKYVKFIAPVRPEDRVKHFLHVVEMRESKGHTDYGVVKFEFFTLNRRHERVAEGWFSVLIKKKTKKQEA